MKRIDITYTHTHCMISGRGKLGGRLSQADKESLLTFKPERLPGHQVFLSVFLRPQENDETFGGKNAEQ